MLFKGDPTIHIQTTRKQEEASVLYAFQEVFQRRVWMEFGGLEAEYISKSLDHRFSSLFFRDAVLSLFVDDIKRTNLLFKKSKGKWPASKKKKRFFLKENSFKVL